MSWTDLLFDHLLTTTLMFVAVWVATRFVKRPLVRHLLWGAMLVKFLLPPLVTFSISWPGADSTSTAEQPVPSTMVSEVHSPAPISANDFTPPVRSEPGEVVGDLPRMPVDREVSTASQVSWPSRGRVIMATGVLWAVGSLCVLMVAIYRVWRFQRLLGGRDHVRSIFASRCR